jgi:hypothetical protein
MPISWPAGHARITSAPSPPQNTLLSDIREAERSAAVL